jgi:hypothetical protein
MSVLDRVREKYGTPRANSENLQSGTCKASKSPSAGSAGSQVRDSEIFTAPLIDLEATRRAIARRAEARARRHRRVLADLAANPALTHAWLATENGDHVILTVAVRGIGSAELTCDAEGWDPLQFVAVTRQ